ncbi:MAG: hemolysin III family protein [Lachnospiraceae bacterium]|nr:hemolysin III family protein [Lachnospiraceae bacterium]
MKFKLKDPGSAITHGIGFVLAVLGVAPLLIKAAREPDMLHLISLGIFILSMILLYAASTIYHSLDISDKVNRRLRKVDHMMIFVLIAGSYTPICLIALHNRTGFILCIMVWVVALAGIITKACWITCPKWFSSVLYIGMGWMVVFAFSQIFHALSRPAFGWLLAGGIIYTVGGIIYALKLPIFDMKHKNFGSHEIFHLFIMAGSACHFIMMYQYIATMPL